MKVHEYIEYLKTTKDSENFIAYVTNGLLRYFRFGADALMQGITLADGKIMLEGKTLLRFIYSYQDGYIIEPNKWIRNDYHQISIKWTKINSLDLVHIELDTLRETLSLEMCKILDRCNEVHLRVGLMPPMRIEGCTFANGYGYPYSCFMYHSTCALKMDNIMVLHSQNSLPLVKMPRLELLIFPEELRERLKIARYYVSLAKQWATIEGKVVISATKDEKLLEKYRQGLTYAMEVYSNAK